MPSTVISEILQLLILSQGMLQVLLLEKGQGMAADSMWQIKQAVYLHADSFYLALSVGAAKNLTFKI